MKTYTIELPLRTIRIELQDKEPLSMETTGLQMYQELHNKLWTVLHYWTQLRERNQQRQVLFSELQQAFQDMETETKKYNMLAGFPEEETEGLFTENETCYIELGKLDQLKKIYATLSSRFMEEGKVLEQMYSNGEVLEEEFSAAYMLFHDQYFTPIINNYDDVQVDTISFDNDVDAFRCFCSKADEIRDLYIDEWNAVNADVLVLNENMNQLNRHTNSLSRSLKALLNPNNRAELN